MPLTSYRLLRYSNDLASSEKILSDLQKSVHKEMSREDKSCKGISASTCYGMLFWKNLTIHGLYDSLTLLKSDKKKAEEYIQQGANMGCPLAHLLIGITVVKEDPHQGLEHLKNGLLQLTHDELRFVLSHLDGYLPRAIDAVIKIMRSEWAQCAESRKVTPLLEKAIKLLFNFYQSSLGIQRLKELSTRFMREYKIAAVQDFLQKESSTGNFQASCLLAPVVVQHDRATVTQHYQLILANWGKTDKTTYNVEIFVSCYKLLEKLAAKDPFHYELLFKFYAAIPGTHRSAEFFDHIKEYTKSKDEIAARLAEEFLRGIIIEQKDFSAGIAYLDVCLKKAADPKLQLAYEKHMLIFLLRVKPSVDAPLRSSEIKMVASPTMESLYTYVIRRKSTQDSSHNELFLLTIEDIRLQIYITHRQEQKTPRDKTALEDCKRENKLTFTKIKNMAEDITCSWPVRKKAVCYVFEAYRDKGVPSEAKWSEFDERSTKALEYAQLGLGLLEPECIAFVGKENRVFRANRRAYLCAFLSVLTHASDAREARTLLATNHPHALYYAGLLPYACEFKLDDATAPQQVFQLILNGPPLGENLDTGSTTIGLPDEEAIRREIRNVVMPELKLDPHQFLPKPSSENPEAKVIHSSHKLVPGDAKEEFKEVPRRPAENPNLAWEKADLRAHSHPEGLSASASPAAGEDKEDEAEQPGAGVSPGEPQERPLEGPFPWIKQCQSMVSYPSPSASQSSDIERELQPGLEPIPFSVAAP